MLVSLLPRQARLGAFTTAAVAVPSAVTSVYVVADMAQATRDDPAARLAVHVFVSPDGGQTWRHDTGLTWVGGSGRVNKLGVINAPPSLRWQGDVLERLKGQMVRAEISVSPQIAVGVQAEVL